MSQLSKGVCFIRMRPYSRAHTMQHAYQHAHGRGQGGFAVAEVFWDRTQNGNDMTTVVIVSVTPLRGSLEDEKLGVVCVTTRSV